jgi:Tfp pilus assembly protein PilO
MFKSLTPILTIITAIILFVFFTQPIYEEIKLINAETADYNSTAEQYSVFNGKLQALLAKKNQINVAQLERLDTMLPATVDIPRVLIDLEYMARSKGMLFGNVVIDSESSRLKNSRSTNANQEQNSVNKALVSSTITFDVIGRYGQFKGFLESLESSLSFMEITRISLTTSSEVFQQYSVTVRMYTLPETQ